MTWIQGNMFKGLTKWHYAPARIFTNNYYRNGINNLPVTDYRYLANTVDFSQLKDGDIIYTHTFYADQLFERLEKLAPTQFTVVTHNCDTPADFPPPDNVMWFTTNVGIRYNGPTFGFGSNIRSIPIGIENDFWLKDKKQQMIRKMEKAPKFKNLIYCNHNVKNNPKIRQKPYDVLSGESWATVHHGSTSFEIYLDNIYNHPFVVCPEGNGIDTHRLWECLYMGTIPVVTKNINNSFYEDLPILFWDSWEQMEEKFLYDSYMQIRSKYWNLEKLEFEYWKDEILGVKRT